VVVDRATGPRGSRAALSWHLTGDVQRVSALRVRVRDGSTPVEVAFVPVGDDADDASIAPCGGGLCYTQQRAGRLHVATVFLVGEWADAQVAWDASTQTLQVVGQDERVAVPVGVGE
jgi:hypothetical protein